MLDTFVAFFAFIILGALAVAAVGIAVLSWKEALRGS